ncbi:ATP phosphoribosyltransferase regulatory subunit [Qipengyuania sediminis]|uniref:ATP phosphoribosyltransferase regulatory subunit n=1 Tax=Qipengyuania sediminis TaxID=1532023 RepID=UPI001059BB7E|nr:ATP phosphoribosyltransferase regulatory subunit [Qipengyuania sediminis]
MSIPDDLLPEGLADALPAEAAAISRAMRAVLDAMDAEGYERVRPPLIEFEAAMARRMDGVSPRRMIRFTDPASLRTMAVRSDMTVQVGRIAATALASAPRPLRLCYAGEVAVIAADQLDPARQRLQLGAELIGSDSVAAASEAVELAVTALEAAGLTGIAVDFTLPDLIAALAAGPLPLGPDQVAAVRHELDMKDAAALEAAGGGAYLPLLYAAGPFEEAIERLAAIDAGGALAGRIAALRQIAETLAGRARIMLDPTERHGFEYQSWFGFTLLAEGARGTLGRGGSYVIHGSEEPAVGFSLYMAPLLEAARLPEPRRNALFLPPGHDRAAARRFRAEGWRTIAALSEDADPRAQGCTHRLDGEAVSPL